MLRRFQRLLSGVALSILMLGLADVSVASTRGSAPKTLADRVQHELLMLPYYGVFDQLAFRVDGETVVLEGQVTRPILKSDAETAVRRTEGVQKVVNNIEVLPLSPMDDSIRLAAYRAIYSRPGFEKYAIQAISPIRIIVKNGNITLEGVVATKMDSILAEMAARSVPVTFGVTNNLKVA